jgi:hypothetical protein
LVRFSLGFGRAAGPSARIGRPALAAVLVLSLLVVASAAGGNKFPTHPLIPGSVVVSESVYPASGDPAIQLGQPLLNGVAASADGKYPEVFNNEQQDPSLAIATPMQLVDVDGSGNQLLQIKVPTDQVTTSFTSKSEGAINFSTDGQDLSFLAYNAPVNALDTSNSNTPQVPDITNPDTAGPFNRVAADLAADGTWSFTDSNAYSGDNGRATLLNSSAGVFYAAGNSNNGTTANNDPITRSGGAQVFAKSTASQADQAPGAAIEQLGTFTFKTTDKLGKDMNFRGLTIFNGVVYLTKGSGSNGTNSVYFVDTTDSACAATNGVGLPATGAALPTAAGAPYRICVLKGFNDLAAKGSSAPSVFPFGIWFANATTLYVADEGTGSNTYDATTGEYTDAAAQTNACGGTGASAGLQKWVFDSVALKWKCLYTIQAGLDLGEPYAVPAYPTGTNSLNGLPWAPATDGLRNISGHLNGDGTVTIYAATSTVSGSGDQGADPNEIVSVTDPIGATSAGSDQFTTIESPQNRTVYRGVAVVPDKYGS